MARDDFKKKQKQTNKQTNKQFLILTISQLNQVQSLQTFQEIFLWLSQDDSNKKTKKTNKHFFSIDNISAI